MEWMRIRPRFGIATATILLVGIPLLAWLNLRGRVSVSHPFDLGLGTPLVDVYVARGWPFDYQGTVSLVPASDVNEFLAALPREELDELTAPSGADIALNVACGIAILVALAATSEAATAFVARRLRN